MRENGLEKLADDAKAEEALEGAAPRPEHTHACLHTDLSRVDEEARLANTGHALDGDQPPTSAAGGRSDGITEQRSLPRTLEQLDRHRRRPAIKDWGFFQGTSPSRIFPPLPN